MKPARVVHVQLYDGGWLAKVERNGVIFTGTGLTQEVAIRRAQRFADEHRFAAEATGDD